MGKFGAILDVQQGFATARQAKRQAEVLREQAAREQEIARTGEQDFRSSESSRAARRRALLGATGGVIGSGSARLVTEDIAREVEQQAGRIRQGGDIRSRRLIQQAGFERARGRQAKTAGFLRGGARLVSGLSTAGAFG